LVLELHSHRPVIVKEDAFDNLIKLHQPRRDDLRVNVTQHKYVETLVHLSVELHQVARYRVDQLFVGHRQREYLVDRASVYIAYGTNDCVEVLQLQEVLKVSVLEDFGLFFLLDLQHILNIVDVS
jgi:hypothetical protein